MVENMIKSLEKQKQLYRRTLIIVIIAQILGGAGLAAGITVGALIAKDMLGTESLARLPIALFTLGSAGAAMLVGRISQKFGRRLGMTIGFMIGGIGAVGVVISTITGSLVLLFLSLFIYGSGTATNLQARYAGTDLANVKQRATAVSLAMVATTFGAVAGPNLVDVMGNFALSLGIPVLAGPFILAAVAYVLAGLVPFIFLRPDPLLVSKAIAENDRKNTKSSAGKLEEVMSRRGIMLGATVMVVSHIVMVAVMTMTPVHMGSHQFTLQQIGMVIGIHIAAMYLPSPLTGILADKFGRLTMVIASGVTLFIAGLVAAFAPGNSLLLMILALALLGLGWNFGLISGTALIVDSTSLATRAKTQGSIDVFVALAGASGGIVSGLIVAFSSFGTLAVIGGLISLSLIPVVRWAKVELNH